MRLFYKRLLKNSKSLIFKSMSSISAPLMCFRRPMIWWRLPDMRRPQNINFIRMDLQKTSFGYISCLLNVLRPRSVFFIKDFLKTAKAWYSNLCRLFLPHWCVLDVLCLDNVFRTWGVQKTLIGNAWISIRRLLEIPKTSLSPSPPSYDVRRPNDIIWTHVDFGRIS